MKTLLIHLAFRHPAFTATPEQITRWQAMLPDVEIIHAPDQQSFIKNLPKADYAFAYNFSPTWFGLAPRLKWLASPGAGRDLLPDWVPPGIRVTTGAFHGEVIGETVLGMILAVNRGLLQGLELQCRGIPWPENQITGTRRLTGTRALILGYGAIGQRIAARLRPLGVSITGLRRNPDPADTESASIETLDSRLPAADHIILALPGDTGADRIINARRLALMKPDAALYNIGRGNAVDEPALDAALRSGHLRAACLDVATREPYPADGPLMTAPRCYLMPHLSAAAPDYLDLAFAEWLARYRACQTQGTL